MIPKTISTSHCELLRVQQLDPRPAYAILHLFSMNPNRLSSSRVRDKPRFRLNVYYVSRNKGESSAGDLRHWKGRSWPEQP